MATLTPALSDALGVGPGDMVAIVGGGGKTTALYRLGDELAARGTAVLLTGTTRFTPPAHGTAPNLTIVDDVDALLRVATNGPWPRTVATGHGTKGRLLPLPPQWLDQLHRARPSLAIVIEADGSAMRPFKAPAHHEPVIPALSTLVVACAGMDVVGRPLTEAHVHRPERVAALTGTQLDECVTAEVVAAVLAHPQGGHKSVPLGARWVALLNKADTPSRRAAADQIATRLRAAGERVVIAQLTREPCVVESAIQ